MQGLRIVSAIGAALTAEEIDAAHRVANTHQEMTFGVVRVEDAKTGVMVEYHAGKRLSMTVPGFIENWYAGKVFPRCGCRSINITESGSQLITKWTETPSNPDDNSILHVGRTTFYWRNTDGSLREVGSKSGSLYESISDVGGILTSRSVYVDFPFARDYSALFSHVMNGTLETRFSGGVSETISDTVTYTPIIDTDEYKAALSSIGGSRVASRAFTSDGQSIAESTEYAFVSRFEYTNGVRDMLTWPGGGWVQTFNRNGSHITPGELLQFNVPDDACLPIGGDGWNSAQWFEAPTYPGTTNPDVQVYYRHTMSEEVDGVVFSTMEYLVGYDAQISFGSYTGSRQTLGEAPYAYYIYNDFFETDYSGGVFRNGNSKFGVGIEPWWNRSNYAAAVAYSDSLIHEIDPVVAKWKTDWRAARISAQLRERNRLKSCSDGMIDLLKEGILPPEIEKAIKTSRPRSSKTKRPVLMNVLENSSSGDGTNFSRTVRISYDINNEDGSTSQIEKVFTGTAVLSIVNHSYTDINGIMQTGTSGRWTFDNFPVLKGTTGEGELSGGNTSVDDWFIDLGFRDEQSIPLWHEGDFGLPMFYVMNGTYQQGQRQQSRYRSTYPYVAAPTVLYPTYDPLVAASTPPYPVEVNSVTAVQPDFLLEYHNRNKPVYVSSGMGDKAWLCSRLVDKEIVSVIPVMSKSSSFDFGLYPHDSDVPIVSKRYVTGYAQFQYRYADGGFTFLRWKDSVDTEGNPEIKEFAANAVFEGVNLVFISDRTQWADAKKAAKDQHGTMEFTQPIPALIDLYREVRSAITGKPKPNKPPPA